MLVRLRLNKAFCSSLRLIREKKFFDEIFYYPFSLAAPKSRKVSEGHAAMQLHNDRSEAGKAAEFISNIIICSKKSDDALLCSPALGHENACTRKHSGLVGEREEIPVFFLMMMLLLTHISQPLPDEKHQHGFKQ